MQGIPASRAPSGAFCFYRQRIVLEPQSLVTKTVGAVVVPSVGFGIAAKPVALLACGEGLVLGAADSMQPGLWAWFVLNRSKDACTKVWPVRLSSFSAPSLILVPAIKRGIHGEEKSGYGREARG